MIEFFSSQTVERREVIEARGALRNYEVNREEARFNLNAAEEEKAAFESILQHQQPITEAVRDLVAATLGDVIGSDVPDRVDRAFQAGLENLFATCRNDSNRASGNMDIFQRRIREQNSYIANTKALLEELGEGKAEFSKARIEADLEGLPGIASKSVYLYMEEEVPFLSFRIEKLITEVKNWRFPHAMDSEGLGRRDRGAKLLIPIDPARVLVNLFNGNIKILPASPKCFAPYAYSSGYPNVHPHILYGHEPCLGDFAEAVTTAVHERDFRTLALMVQAFLRQVDGADPAGAHIKYYFDKFEVGRSHNGRDYKNPIGDRNSFYFFQQQEDGSWIATASQRSDRFVPCPNVPLEKRKIHLPA